MYVLHIYANVKWVADLRATISKQMADDFSYIAWKMDSSKRCTIIDRSQPLIWSTTNVDALGEFLRCE